MSINCITDLYDIEFKIKKELNILFNNYTFNVETISASNNKLDIQIRYICSSLIKLTFIKELHNKVANILRNIGLNITENNTENNTEDDSNLILHLPKNEVNINNALTILRLRNT